MPQALHSVPISNFVMANRQLPGRRKPEKNQKKAMEKLAITGMRKEKRTETGNTNVFVHTNEGYTHTKAKKKEKKETNIEKNVPIEPLVGPTLHCEVVVVRHQPHTFLSRLSTGGWSSARGTKRPSSPLGRVRGRETYLCCVSSNWRSGSRRCCICGEEEEDEENGITSPLEEEAAR